MIGCLLTALGCAEVNSAKRAGAEVSLSGAAQEPAERTLLTAAPRKIDLGTVPPGGRAQATFTLTNPGTQEVEVARIASSCPCLKLDVPKRIAPGECVSARAKIDLRAEADFTGDLGITVEGRSRAGELAFAVSVEIQVPREAAR